MHTFGVFFLRNFNVEAGQEVKLNMLSFNEDNVYPEDNIKKRLVS